MRAFLTRHRLALGYVLVALFWTAVALAAMALYPEGVRQLQARGYEMQEPGYLWLLAAAPILWFVRLHTLTDLPLGQQLLSVLLRTAMIAALALALTRITHISHEPRRVATVMLVDVSDSVPDEVLAGAQTRLEALWKEKGDGVVRLVTFAEEAQVVALTADAKGTLPRIARHRKGTLGTDLQAALRLAYGLYPPGHKKRLVVVTDGNETRGHALSEVDTAKRLGIGVSYLSMPTTPPPPELMVAGLDVPTDIEINVPFDVQVTVKSNRSAAVKCTLKVDDIVAGVEKATLEPGEKVLEFARIRVRRGGEHAFRVDCGPEVAEGQNVDPATLDRFASNNRFDVSRKVEEKKRLLYVEGEGLYSKNFRDAMADDVQVKVAGARGIPSSLASAKRYKAIVISDVPRQTRTYRENMTYAQMKMLHQYANEGGVLVFTGGQDSFGPGGYTGTYLERSVLPVKLEVEHELETPRLAMVLAIDRSGSMSGPRIELAKKAARETVKVLGRQDVVGIVAFDATPREIQRLTTAGSVARFERAVSRLTAAGGTNIFGALDASFRMLEGVEAQLKHVILLTDGMSSRKGIGALVQRAARRGITVSTIAISAQADRALLAEIAEIGKGRAYYTESPESIPRLFVDETKQVARDAVVPGRFRPVLSSRFASERFLRGVPMRGAPSLGGYVTVKAKPKTDVILKLNNGDPLLVRWRRGKGWVYVFTSDIKNKWGRRWLQWAGFAPFWRQLVKASLPEEKKERLFPIEVDVARGKLTVATDAVDSEDRFVAGVESKAYVTDPTGTRREVVLERSAAGRYEAVVPANQYGPYRIDVVHSKDGKKIAESHGRIAYPYAEELLHMAPDLRRVDALARATGGTMDPSVRFLLDDGGERLTHKAPAWHWLLYFVLAALLVDVLLRRVRFWTSRTRSWGTAIG